MKLLKLQNADNQVVFECASKKLKKYCKKMSEKFAGNKKVRIFAAQFGNDPSVKTRIQFIDKFEKDY